MPIDIVGRTTTGLTDTNQKTTVGSSASQKPGPGNSEDNHVRADKVSLTETAAWLRHVQTGLENVPIVDMARVESVKSAIADGSYEIDASRVADKILQMETALYQQPRT